MPQVQSTSSSLGATRSLDVTSRMETSTNDGADVVVVASDADVVGLGRLPIGVVTSTTRRDEDGEQSDHRDGSHSIDSSDVRSPESS